MSESALSAFARLKDLAREPSSEHRRELLRNISDMFLADPTDRSDTECMLFDEVVSSVVRDMEVSVRAELSEKLSTTGAAINTTLRNFALDDDIRVAGPVLKNSTVLTEEDLLAVVSTKTQEHMLAITQRAMVPEKVSGALVERGSDAVVASLLENEGAIINRESMEMITDRAAKSQSIQRGMIRRKDMPLDLLNELTLVVQKDLRNQLLERFNNLTPQEVDAALARSRRTVREKYQKETRDQKRAQERIDALHRGGKLRIEVVLKFLQEEDYPCFSEALGRISGVGYENASRIYRESDIDSLALIMKAMDAPLPLFATTAAYIAGVENALDQVKAYAGLYKEIPAEAARRAIRFWRVRNGVAEAA